MFSMFNYTKHYIVGHTYCMFGLQKCSVVNYPCVPEGADCVWFVFEDHFIPAVLLHRYAELWIWQNISNFCNFDSLLSTTVTTVDSQWLSPLLSQLANTAAQWKQQQPQLLPHFVAFPHVSSLWLDNVILQWHSGKWFWLIKKHFSTPTAGDVTGFLWVVRGKWNLFQLNSYCSSPTAYWCQNMSADGKPEISSAEKNWDVSKLCANLTTNT